MAAHCLYVALMQLVKQTVPGTLQLLPLYWCTQLTRMHVYAHIVVCTSFMQFALAGHGVLACCMQNHLL
jgi:hypothetical protein